MSIVAGDIKIRGTTTSGAAGNSTAFGGAGTSLGKYATSDDITDATANNLFPDVTGAENAVSNVDYQAIGVYNSNGATDWTDVTIYLSAETAGGVSCAVGADTTAASAIGSAGAQLLTIANKDTAPAGVSFTTATTYAAGTNIGTIPHGDVKGLWIRRTASNSAALSSDDVTLGIAGDTT